jgi:type II secretory pathway pseudopilin PulG
MRAVRSFFMRRAQRGVTLIEMILVIGLMAMMTILTFYEKQSDFEQARAKVVGGLIFQYNNAVREALAKNIPASSANYAGSAWLKSSACGGMLTPGQEYLPCDFPLATVTNPVPFGNLSFTTIVAVSGTPPNRTFTATTSTSAFSVGDAGTGMKVRADLSGLAVLAAASAVGTGVQSVSGGASPIAATTDSHFNSDPLTAVMTFTASNTASSDVWLRTDGSNSMHKTLNFDGAAFADRQITGASRIQNIAGQALFLGAGSGLTAVTGSGLIVDTDAEILGSFRVRNILLVDGATNLGSTLNVSGNTSMGGTLAVSGAVTTGSTITAGGNVYAPIYVDSNDGNYYVDPNGTSRQNAVLANTSYASVFYDINNPGYYVQPSGATRLNGIWANGIVDYGNLEVGQFLQLDAVSTQGLGCAPNGLVSRDALGGLLSCTNGAWASPGVSIGTPVTVLALGPTLGVRSWCWVSANPAMITATGPGATTLTVNGVTVGTSMGWGGEFSNIGMDFAISGIVPAGGTYCYYVTNNKAYSYSSGIRVVSSSL